MRFFNRLKKKNNICIDDILSKEYQQKYFDECKYIWKNYVPEYGQASCLQGELLREIEKICIEAKDNGNINWDDDYIYFCDFIIKNLTIQNIFSDEEKQEIRIIMNYLKDCGTYAKRFYNGEILDEDVDMEQVAYVDDNLYDRICDKIGFLQKECPDPIHYEINNHIKR